MCWKLLLLMATCKTKNDLHTISMMLSIHSQVGKELSLDTILKKVLCTIYEVQNLVAEELIWVESKRLLAMKPNTRFIHYQNFRKIQLNILGGRHLNYIPHGSKDLINTLDSVEVLACLLWKNAARDVFTLKYGRDLSCSPSQISIQLLSLTLIIELRLS